MAAGSRMSTRSVPMCTEPGSAERSAALAAASLLEAAADQQRRPLERLLGLESAEDRQRRGVVEQGGGGLAPTRLGLRWRLQRVVDEDTASGRVGEGVRAGRAGGRSRRSRRGPR